MGRDDLDRERKKKKKNEKDKKKTKRRHSSGISSLDYHGVLVNEKIRKTLLKLRKLTKKKKRDKKKKDKNLENKVNSYKISSVISDQSKKFAPMTKEEWEKQVKTFRRVYDEETGRTRLIKGNGEIVEECVSREKQLLINKMATIKDGEYFQKVLSSSTK